VSKRDLTDTTSYSFLMNHMKSVDKFDQLQAMVGSLMAKQAIRPIGRLHSPYYGYRTELDYTRYARYLYPTERWVEPILYYTGFGIDDYSSVLKGFITTVAPSTRSTVRLYRNCVLPASMWLPAHLQHIARQWDAFGLEVIVAIDNASDFTSHGVSLMFIINGCIILRMPVASGDLKGTVERVNMTIETEHVSGKSGYVPQEFSGLDPRYKAQRKRAKSLADSTVLAHDSDLCAYFMKYNDGDHPQFRRSRNLVMRESQTMAPIILPTGLQNIQATFALTYSVKLLREGVQVERLKFNSKELGEAFRRYSGQVIVKLDPDDVRHVLVFVPHQLAPIEASLTTFALDFKVSLELLNVLLDRVGLDVEDLDPWPEDVIYNVLSELSDLQTKEPTRTPGRTRDTDAEAATHAEAAPAAASRQESPSAGLEELLRGSQIPNE
jgi:Mu transposase, C-terminal